MAMGFDWSMRIAITPDIHGSTIIQVLQRKGNHHHHHSYDIDGDGLTRATTLLMQPTNQGFRRSGVMSSRVSCLTLCNSCSSV